MVEPVEYAVAARLCIHGLSRSKTSETIWLGALQSGSGTKLLPAESHLDILNWAGADGWVEYRRESQDESNYWLQVLRDHPDDPLLAGIELTRVRYVTEYWLRRPR